MVLQKEVLLFLLDSTSPFFLIGTTILLLVACSNPVEPEFEFTEGLIYIDALATTETGSSYAIVSETKNLFGITKAVEIKDADVSFVNEDSGAKIVLTEMDGIYMPPSEFKINEDELWYLRVLLKDGREYVSVPEKGPKPVPEASFDVLYKKQLVYSEGHERFIPGHEISATFNDPPNDENYYYWRFKSFEKLINCKTCYDYQIYREGTCIIVNPQASSIFEKYYTYECEEDCWEIRYSQNIKILSDEFVNGKMVSQIPVAEVLLYTNDNVLVHLQQYSISPIAYKYLKTLKDLVDNNGGFNSPLPAALIGNIYNSNDSEEFVLGRFTMAASNTTPIFIERIHIRDFELDPRVNTNPEGDEVPQPIVTMAPCNPGRYRTTSEPLGWQ